MEYKEQQMKPEGTSRPKKSSLTFSDPGFPKWAAFVGLTTIGPNSNWRGAAAAEVYLAGAEGGLNARILAKEDETGGFSAMEVVGDENELKAAGAQLLADGRRGLRIHGWEIETRKRSILNSSTLEEWEQKLGTSHLPEMIFGESALILKHLNSGTSIHFNAFDALAGWKQEGLPPVEVPAAAKWKFRSKPFQEVILDYDYTFTTPYCGSEPNKINAEDETEAISKVTGSLLWDDCEERIDMVALAVKEPILFYDEIILYEDELADNGISLLTVKVRVMPSCWFLLLRFWLRVDGVLMRLRDTRMYCGFEDQKCPSILRESCWREATFEALAAKGYPSDASSYGDPSIISQRLPIVMHKTQKLVIPDNL